MPLVVSAEDGFDGIQLRPSQPIIQVPTRNVPQARVNEVVGHRSAHNLHSVLLYSSGQPVFQVLSPTQAEDTRGNVDSASRFACPSSERWPEWTVTTVQRQVGFESRPCNIQEVVEVPADGMIAALLSSEYFTP